MNQTDRTMTDDLDEFERERSRAFADYHLRFCIEHKLDPQDEWPAGLQRAFDIPARAHAGLKRTVNTRIPADR